MPYSPRLGLHVAQVNCECCKREVDLLNFLSVPVEPRLRQYAAAEDAFQIGCQLRQIIVVTMACAVDPPCKSAQTGAYGSRLRFGRAQQGKTRLWPPR
ncbi:hypothetical protein NOVOSPHI9U_60020 [Novosphingobium sp. 9U]|nr:hypothetical protein NOVOSPHI9U_60020 [Novosphingobium sp. 9U]